MAGVKVWRSTQHIGDELLSAMTDYIKELYKFPVAYNFEATKYYPQLIPFLETRHTFNSLDGKTYFIETEEREDICAAFDVILNAVQSEVSGTDFNINTKQIYEIMYEHRDW